MQMADTSLNAAYYKTLKTRITDRDCAETRKAKTNTYFSRTDGDSNDRELPEVTGGSKNPGYEEK